MSKERLDFATVVNSTTYDGEMLESFILKAFTANKTVGLVPASNVVDGIVEKTRVGKLESSNIIQVGPHCDFNDQGTVTISEGLLEPKDIYVNMKLCHKDLRPIFNTLRNGGSLNDAELSAQFTQALSDDVISKFNEAWEDAVWNGVYTTGATSSTDLFDGFDKQITTHALTGATITASNVISVFNSLLQALPNDVLEKDDLTIFVNQKTLQLYFDALFALGIMTPQGATSATYKGYPVVAISKIANNKVYAMEASNMFFGIGAMSDFEAFQILNMVKTTGDNAVRVILQARGDVLLGWESEAVKYTGS